MTTYRIKALEWFKAVAGLRARTNLYIYAVNKEGKKYSAQFYGSGCSDGLGYHDTEAQAKAACSDHWESLVKQSLEEVCTTQHQ